jgi:hypothetical protein
MQLAVRDTEAALGAPVANATDSDERVSLIAIFSRALRKGRKIPAGRKVMASSG